MNDTEPQLRTIPTAHTPEGWVTATVPPLPEGARSGWRRAVTAADSGGTGIDAMPGTSVDPGVRIALPPGRLLLVVDRQATGSAVGRYGRYTTEDATVRILRADPDDWTEVWGPKTFTRSASATGKTVLKALDGLLPQPAPTGEPVLLAYPRRPNRRYAPHCRRCARPVAAGDGHLNGHGKAAEVEHWRCPPPGTPDPKSPRPPLTCDNCDNRGRGHTRTDSSGIQGHVCARCSREPSYVLSFA